jgi:hypothetical protein
VAAPDGSRVVRASCRGLFADAVELGRDVWRILVDSGADRLLGGFPVG